MHLGDRGPRQAVLAHVVPAHLIHASLEDNLIVGVDWLLDQSGHAQLVDVQCGRVAVVEDQRVAQVVQRGSQEGFLACI